MSYLTTGRSGHAQTMVAAHKSSSAALQLPFILFGLGETPNFIERLTVGMVVNTTSGTGTGVEVRFRTWKNLVPNSQVIVIPTPPYRPSRYCSVCLYYVRVFDIKKGVVIVSYLPTFTIRPDVKMLCGYLNCYPFFSLVYWCMCVCVSTH